MNPDPKEYYKILNVPVSASTEEIKASYRDIAKRLHPDLNPGIDTTAIFQKVNEAYSVLSDPIQRNRYSSSPNTPPENRSDTYKNTAPKQEKNEPLVEPYRCSNCNCISPKLRHIKYNQVVSFIFASHRSTIWGVFCEKCASEKIRKASLITGAVGWMSAPGIFYSLFALGRNLTGGYQEDSINMEICLRQSIYYSKIKEVTNANLSAVDGIEFANSILRGDPTNPRATEVLGFLRGILLNDPSQSRQQAGPERDFANRSTQGKDQNRSSSEKHSESHDGDTKPVGHGVEVLATVLVLVMLVFPIFLVLYGNYNQHSIQENYSSGQSNGLDSGLKSEMIQNYAAQSVYNPVGTIVFKKEKWNEIGRSSEFSNNFERREKRYYEKFNQVVTVFKTPMSEGRNSGKLIFKDVRQEIFKFHENSLTCIIRFNKGNYWIMSRQTFATVNPDVPLQADLESSPDLLYRYEELFKDQIMETVLMLRDEKF
jgi:hypothetical protein